jgi:ABC-type transport system involved in multi-copper enzyme maturation permease subunit
VYEWLTTTRRWQLYALRAGFIWLILVGMAVVWKIELKPDATVSIQEAARYGESIYKMMIGIELTLVLLVAPAATAGAVSLDRARGTLDHMLVTELSDVEIVLGKLGVRLLPVLLLITCPLPVTALSGLLGGIDPLAIAGSFLTAIGCAVLGCALALTLSVWGRKTHEVLMLCYLLLILWLFIPTAMTAVVLNLRGTAATPTAFTLSVYEWTRRANPYYLAVAPYSDPGKVTPLTYLGFLAACLFVSGMLVWLATFRIRAVTLREAGRPQVMARRRRDARIPWLTRLMGLPTIPGPSLDANPVLWREWQRTQPSRVIRAVWTAYAAVGASWLTLALVGADSLRSRTDSFVFLNMFQVSVGLLLLSVDAATSLAEERARGSLEVLLSTPLSTDSILMGKWWGTFRQARRIVIWPALSGGWLVVNGGDWLMYLLLIGLVLAFGAGITSLGLALATWVSRLGRAVGLCVATYVLASIGCALLIVPMFRSQGDGVIVPFIMGVPLYGAVFATLAVASEGYGYPGALSMGQAAGPAFLWILVHGAVAAALFVATALTFDRCVGRISNAARSVPPRLTRKLAGELEPHR